MPELYTIGYEGVSQAALLRTLVFHDVQTLPDIRELPQSRKPGLSKTALGLAANDMGLIGEPADAALHGFLARIGVRTPPEGGNEAGK